MTKGFRASNSAKVPNMRIWATIVATLIASLAAASALAANDVARHKPAPAYRLNPALLDLPKGRWIKIHQQRFGEIVNFRRQKHGGSAFDSRRGRLVLFGSDTHGRNWINSPLFFYLERLAWRRLYPNDPLSTYAVTAEGLPVAGPEGDHPWAMHTFGAVTYDPAADAIVVSSYPGHMVPGRFTSILEPLWPRVQRHPTWVLHLESGQWEPLAGESVHFFPYATAFDARRGVVVGYRNDGVYELLLATGQWRKLVKGGLLGWGTNAVYDSRNEALVVFGSHEERNDVVVYEAATDRHQTMPTPGPRPAGANYVPMAYHPDIGRTVAIIDRALAGGTRSGGNMRAQTWLYDLAEDAWTLVEGAALPFGVGMNYNLEFDPGHRLLLLVTDPPGELVAVWALRLGDGLPLYRQMEHGVAPAARAIQEKGEVIRRDRLTLDLDRQEVSWDGTAVTLTPLEFKIVVLISDRPNEVISDEEIHALMVAKGSDSARRGDVRGVILALRRKFRGVDPAFVGIVFYPGRGFGWSQ